MKPKGTISFVKRKELRVLLRMLKSDEKLNTGIILISAALHVHVKLPNKDALSSAHKTKKVKQHKQYIVVN